jgi:NADH-quinone oxidoreductase subunit I
MKLNDLIKKILFIDIIKGMSLTLSRFFSKPVTRRYPKVKRQTQLGFRGLHALTRNPSTGEAKCVGCGLCAAICPSQCISIYTSEGPDHEKIVDRYEIEVLRCVYCSFCVEACPYGAVALTPHYEYSEYSREAFHMTRERLLENWDKYMKDGGYEYFDHFWYPKSSHFTTPEGQAVFKKKGSG